MSSRREFSIEHQREDLRARRWKRYCELIRALQGPIRIFAALALLALGPHAVSSLIERL
jgi:hypothetical protein